MSIKDPEKTVNFYRVEKIDDSLVGNTLETYLHNMWNDGWKLVTIENREAIFLDRRVELEVFSKSLASGPPDPPAGDNEGSES